MKSWVSDRRLIAGIFSLALISLSSAAFANVGRTVGTYAVSPTGAATYTIPIWAPRGPNGLQPNISLIYNSQHGSGYVGVGWAVAGISSIYRCDLTYAQDGSPAPVTMTTSDGLCLDGQRLRLTSGTQGEAGSTYQTEVANFENVTAYGTAGNGPAYFVVQAPNGVQYEYGNTASSQVLAGDTAFEWYLDKVTDAAQNTMTFSYNIATGAVVPGTISWTPTSHDATNYSYTMTFGYGTNADSSSSNGYVAGTNIQNTNLLQSIAIDYEGNTVKKYALTYQQSPTTGADELTNIQECADSAQTNCLAPTTLEYQDPLAGTATSATTAVSGAQTQLDWHYDFSGDGFDDLAYCNSSQQVEVAFASTSGYGTPVNTRIACTGYVLYGDLLGSGKDGILADNGGTWYYYQWDGSSFVGQSTGLAYQSATQYVLADVTGDGLPALVELQATSTGAAIYVRLNMSSGSTVSFSSTNAEWWSTTWGGTATYYLVQLESTSDGQAGSVRHLHFTGDGREDLALQDQVETCTEENGPGGKPEEVCAYAESADELISTGSGFDVTQIASLRGSAPAWPIVDFLNFNSDDCTDYLYNSVIYVSGCDGQPAATVPVPSSNIIGVMDWNGDKLDDILVNNGGTIGVYESTGTGLTSLTATRIPYSASDQYFAFNPYGDGLDALGAWTEFSSPYAVTYHPHNGTGEPPDLLTSVTDGYGNFAKPTYVSLAQSVNSTYSGSNDAQYPDQNYYGPLYVVYQTTFSDPSNPPDGTYQQTNYYGGAWMNLEGRGFEGFADVQFEDSRNGLLSTSWYDRTFPYTGMLNGYIVRINQTQQLVVDRSYTLDATELSNVENEEQYFPYVSSSTETDYEVGGADNGDPVETKNESYSYDPYGNVTSATQTVTDNDSGDVWTRTVTNTPDPDTATWCLRLLRESEISYTVSDNSPSVPRTRDYTPDTTHCAYTEIVTAPGSSYAATEDLHYDSFGNVDKDTVTGTGMAARVTSADWGTTGQFPMSVTDAAGAITQFNYDFSYGLVSSETDPNGLVTSWQYADGFGRVTQENQPDGTYSTYAYNLNTGGPLTRLIEVAQPHDTAGNVLTTKEFYYDMLDRPLYRIDTLLDGSLVWATIQNYDWLGRVASTCAPYPVLDSSSPGCTTYNYDVLNRPMLIERPISQSDSTLETTSYDYALDTTTIKDPYENTRTLTRDVNGWLRQTQDSMGYAVSLGYDAAGSRISATDSLGNTLWSGTYAYGIAPFLVGESDMDRGAWGYTVDALGERTAWVDAKGQQFYESYDALSRPLTRTEPDLFTKWTWGSSASGHNIGKLASVCTGTGSACSSSYYSESETYDSVGRLSQRSIAIPGMGTYAYTWQYSATTGLLNTLTYPISTSGQALELQYAYQNGTLQSITDILDSPNVTIWQANAENPAEQITQESLGNGLVTSRAYDGVTHWLSSVQSAPSSGSSVQNQSFLYDEVGDVTQRQDNDLGLSENLYYDNDYRLSHSTLNGTQNLFLNYDKMGNITSRTDVAGGASWTYDPVHLHEVTEAGSSSYQYAYDANGNATSRQGSSIIWSSYNYPTQINDTATGETVSFVYGPDRRAWFEETQSSSGTETDHHVGGLFDIVTSAGVTEYRHYIYAGSEPVAIDSRASNGTNAFYYLLSDHQGSIAAITNSTGAVVVGESFTAYGARRNPSTWSGAPSSSNLNTIAGITRNGYTFQDALGAMGLNDMVGRVQDAITGRFLSADPTIPDPSNPQSYNRYGYTVNNPLTYIDPTGFDDTAVNQNANSGSGAPVTLPPVCICQPWASAALEQFWDSLASMSGLGAPGVPPISGVHPASPAGPLQTSSPPQSNPTQSEYPTVTIPGLSVTVSALGTEDSTIDTDQWDMSGGYETALGSEVGSVLSKAHGKGERGFTAKPEFKPKPGKLPKGVRPSSSHPGQFEVKDPHTGNWVLKPPGWSPNVGMIGFGAAALGVLRYLATECVETGICEAF